MNLEGAVVLDTENVYEEFGLNILKETIKVELTWVSMNWRNEYRVNARRQGEVTVWRRPWTAKICVHVAIFTSNSELRWQKISIYWLLDIFIRVEKLLFRKFLLNLFSVGLKSKVITQGRMIQLSAWKYYAFSALSVGCRALITKEGGRYESQRLG